MKKRSRQICRKCGEPLYVTIRRHRQRLCRDHFIAWFQDKTDRTVQKFSMFDHSHRILAAVSGGKDSLALWDTLLRRGYRVEGLFIDLGIGDGFSDESLRSVRAFLEAEHPEAVLHVFSLKEEYGASIPELVAAEERGRRKPCALCGLVKRHIMNSFTLKHGFDALATGHTLDDEASILLRNVIHWETGYLERQGPVLNAGPGFCRKVKPFVRFLEAEIRAYARARGIQPAQGKCPFEPGSSTNRYKKLLHIHESAAPGASLHFYQEFLETKKEGKAVFRGTTDRPLLPCPTCGTPTNTAGLCAFCRIWERRKNSI